MKYSVMLEIELDNNEDNTKLAAKAIKKALKTISKDIFINSCEHVDKSDCQYCCLKKCDGCRGTYDY